MSKGVISFLLALLLLFSLARSSRPGPAHPANRNIQQTQEQAVDVESIDAGESCDGVGEEECLMRRTLVAHVDYIYTQRNKKP